MSLEKVIEIAEGEEGYKQEKYDSKYSEFFFPGERPMGWCIPFIEWVFVKVYGEKEAKRKLHIDEFTQSVNAFANYFKQAKMWSWKQAGNGWVIFIRSDNAYMDHAGLVVYADPDIVTSFEGNVNGEVKRVTRKRDDYHIAGYGKVEYEEGETL